MRFDYYAKRVRQLRISEEHPSRSLANALEVLCKRVGIHQLVKLNLNVSAENSLGWDPKQVKEKCVGGREQ